MSEARHQHPVAAVSQVLEIIRGNIIPILLVIFAGSSDTPLFESFGIVSVLIFLLVSGILSWWRFTYRLTDGVLHIRKGIFVRKNIYLSSERIQVIDITTGVIQRLFGLVAVEVKTAGSSSKEARIDAVTRSEAERIKHLLRKNNKETSSEETREAATPRVYSLGMKDLIIAASTSGNLAVTLSIVAGAMSQLDQFITEERIIQLFETSGFTSPGTGSIIIFAFIALLISWIFSFLGTVIKHYGFTLRVKEDELHIESGLFEQKQLTIPFNRIQAIRIKEELLRQPFGYSALYLESAGYGDKQSNAATLFPLLRSNKTKAFLQEVIPGYNVEAEGIRPSKRALRRYLLRMVWISLVGILPVWVMVPNGAYAWLLLVPALVLGYYQHRDALIGTVDNTMIVRTRTLSRTTAIIKKHRIQMAEVSQNPFQKRLQLFTYSATVASGNGGRTFKIHELDEPGDLNYFDWVSPAFREPPPAGAP